MKSRLFPKGFPSLLKRYKSISSTNDVALDYLAEKGKESNGAVFIAEYQEKGRGRLGRSWFANANQNLLMSFIFVPPEDFRWNFLPLAVGLSCVKAIEKYIKVNARIKWPNDIIYESKKMGGILTESKMKGSALLGIVAGVGVNVKGVRGNFPEDLFRIATTMEESSKQMCSVEEFTNILLKEIPDALESLFADSKSFVKEVEELLVHQKGEEIEISSGENCILGNYEGLNENGEIILSTKKGLQTFNCGEIVRARNIK